MQLGRESLLLVTALSSSARALLVAPGSPCAKYCGNVLSATTSADMECFDDPAKYSTSSTGNVLQNCITCETTSTYTSAGQSDLRWLLYNIRYMASTCLFGVPDNDAKKLNTGPCITRTACEPLTAALQWQNFSTAVASLDYCKAWDSVAYGKCGNCLRPGNHFVVNNLMTMLEAACEQKPIDGLTISVSDPPFSTNIAQITDPTPTGFVQPDQGPLNLGAKVGIAAAGVILALATAGCCIVCNGKRRRRAYLRNLEKRQAQAQGAHWHADGSNRDRWPGSQSGGGGADMFETPVSQKPLFTNWETSPVSAHTDHTGFSTGLSPALEKGTAGPSTFPSRYFSPYSSQYNSPVGGAEHATQWPPVPEGQHNQQHQAGGIVGGGAAAWPTSTQEKLFQLAQMQREQEQVFRLQLQQQLQGAASLSPADIGVALGGDDPSLRSKPSAQSLQAQQDEHAGQIQQQQDQKQPQQQQQQQQQGQHQSPWGFSDVKGKHPDYYNTEEYELHEVDSNGSMRLPAAPPAPVLNHPGYGRYPPPPAEAAVRQQWV